MHRHPQAVHSLTDGHVHVPMCADVESGYLLSVVGLCTYPRSPIRAAIFEEAGYKGSRLYYITEVAHANAKDRVPTGECVDESRFKTSAMSQPRRHDNPLQHKVSRRDVVYFIMPSKGTEGVHHDSLTPSVPPS